MASILKLYLDIALLRRGPEDLPSSKALLFWTVIAFITLNALLMSVFPTPEGSWLPPLLVALGFNLVWYRVVLTLFGKPERFLQTVTAYIGFSCIVRLITVPLAAMMAPYAANPDTMPAPLLLVGLPVSAYLIYVAVRILKSAIERPVVQCLLLVLLQVLLEFLLVAGTLGEGAAASPAGTVG